MKWIGSKENPDELLGEKICRESLQVFTPTWFPLGLTADLYPKLATDCDIPKVGYATMRCHQWKGWGGLGSASFEFSFCCCTQNMAMNDHYDVVPPSVKSLLVDTPALLVRSPYLYCHKPEVLESANLAFTTCVTINHTWLAGRSHIESDDTSSSSFKSRDFPVNHFCGVPGLWCS